jgi:molecular chaperone DnaJ
VTRKDGTRGDLLATVDVQVPSGLTDEAREALERFVEASGVEDPRKDLLEAAKGA